MTIENAIGDRATLRTDLERISRDPAQARAAVDALLEIADDVLHEEGWDLERRLCQTALTLAVQGPADPPSPPDACIMEKLAATLGNERVQSIVVGALIAVGPAVLPVIEPRLEKGDSRICHAALRIVRCVSASCTSLPGDLTRQLEDLVSSRDPRVRGESARCLLATGVQEVRLAGPIIDYAADCIERGDASDGADPSPMLSALTTDLLRIGPDLFEALSRSNASDHPAFLYWIQSTLALLEAIYIA